MAALRMILANVPFKNINIPTISNAIQSADDKFDIVTSNPPFGAGNPAQFPLAIDNHWKKITYKSNRATVHFLGHILSILSNKGKAAVIVPTIFLSDSSLTHDLVKEIIDQNILDTVIKLPRDTFHTTKVESAIMIFNKERTTNNIVLIDVAENIGQENILSLQDTIQIGQLINEIKSKSKTSKGGCLVTSQQIEQNGYRLQVSDYLPEEENIQNTKKASLLWQECESLELQLAEIRCTILRFLQKTTDMVRKKRQNISKPLSPDEKRCFYQNGKRSFQGTEKDVAKYAFRDQYLQWIIGLLLLSSIIFSILHDTGLFSIAGLSMLIKKWLH